MFSFEELRAHPDFKALSRPDQDRVTTKYIDQRWIEVEGHDGYNSLGNNQKQEVRSNFMRQFYGDALEAPAEVYEPTPEDLKTLQPKGTPRSILDVAKAGSTSVHAPVKNIPQEGVEPNGTPYRSLGTAKNDLLISATKGAIGVTQAIQGMIDIPTLGRFGYLTEQLGYQPEAAKKILDSFYSDAQKDANAEVEEARGFVDTVKTMLENPSTIVQGVAESGPSMLAAGLIGRGLSILPKISPYVGAAIGEGMLSAGDSAENIIEGNKQRAAVERKAQAWRNNVQEAYSLYKAMNQGAPAERESKKKKLDLLYNKIGATGKNRIYLERGFEKRRMQESKIAPQEDIRELFYLYKMRNLQSPGIRKNNRKRSEELYRKLGLSGERRERLEQRFGQMVKQGDR